MNIKFTLKSALLAFLAFGSYLAGYAQSNTGFIRGTVYRDNRPIANVPIILRDENEDSIKMVKSEINGEYSFSNLPVGLYSIKIAAVPITEGKGYAAYEVEAMNISIEGQVLNISLVTKVKVLDDVRVGGTKTKVSDGGTTTTKKLSDAQKTGIRSMVGFAGLSGGVNSGPSGLSNRGSRTDGNATYIDGVRVQSASANRSFKRNSSGALVSETSKREKKLKK
jgi:hypothetical protein